MDNGSDGDDARRAGGAHPENGPLRACEANMENFMSTTGESGDLFGKISIPRGGPVIQSRPPSELTVARALCRQLRRTRAPRDKQRIAHLICLNLLAMLRHGS